MKPGLAKTIEKVHISWFFESPEIILHKAENARCIEYTDIWLSKRVHWLLQSQSPNRGISNYGCEDTLQLYTVVAWASLPNTGIHTGVALKSETQWLPATFHNSRWMDHCEICRRSMDATSILDPVDVEEAYSHIASRYHSVQWYVRSHGWCHMSFG